MTYNPLNTVAKASLAKTLSLAALLISFSLTMSAQSAPSSSGMQKPAAQSGPQQTQKPQDIPAEAGGPNGDIGPIAVPKKKNKEEQPPAEKPPKVKNPEGMPEYSIRVDVPLVNVDVSVLTKDGQFIPGLKKENFKIYEDGVPQKVERVETAEAPITAVLLVEFAATHPAFIYDMLNASYSFADQLKKDDYVALISYDMKPQIQVDFTQDKRAFYAGLNQLRVPGFRETNLFDALYDTIDRLEGIEGRKYIILISSGVDTFSKINYDKALAKVKGSQDIMIYCVGTGQALRIMAEGQMGDGVGVGFLQADNQLSTFARMTGGKAYFPRFAQEMPEIFHDIGNTIRNQYVVSYHPSNSKFDGTWRKLKVELTDGAGGPMKVQNEKGKPLKYIVVARDGYKARQQVE